MAHGLTEEKEKAVLEALAGMGYNVPQPPVLHLIEVVEGKEKPVDKQPRFTTLGLIWDAAGKEVVGLRLNPNYAQNPTEMMMDEADRAKVFVAVGLDPNHLPSRMGGVAKGVSPVQVKKESKAKGK